MQGSSYQRLDSTQNVIEIGGESVAPLPRSTELQIGNAIFFLFFLITNLLAASGVFPHDPRSIRHAEPTHLDPADYTFLIWPLIFILTALFALYQAPPHRRTNIPVFGDIHGLFILACLFQVSWVLCLSYDAPPVVPLILIVLLLLALLSTYFRLNRYQATTASLATTSSSLATPVPQYICVNILFSVFLAWVTMETAWMVSWMLRYQAGWYGKPWTESGWAVVVLALLAVVTMVILFRRRDGVFGLIIAWACFGIAKGQHHFEEVKIAGYVFGGILFVTSLLALALKYRRWEEERSGLKVRIIQSTS